MQKAWDENKLAAIIQFTKADPLQIIERNLWICNKIYVIFHTEHKMSAESFRLHLSMVNIQQDWLDDEPGTVQQICVQCTTCIYTQAEKVVSWPAIAACEALTPARLICQSQIRRFLSHRPKIPNNRQGQRTSFVRSRPLIASQRQQSLGLSWTSWGLVCLAEASRMPAAGWCALYLFLPDKASLHSAVASGHAASCICSPVSRPVLFLVIPTSSPRLLQASHPFPRHQMLAQKKDKTVMRTENNSTRWSFSMMKQRSPKIMFQISNISLHVFLSMLACCCCHQQWVSMGPSNISGSAAAAALLFIWTILFQISPNKGLMQFEME